MTEFLEDGLIVAEFKTEAWQWVKRHQVLAQMVARFRSGQISDIELERLCGEMDSFVESVTR